MKTIYLYKNDPEVKNINRFKKLLGRILFERRRYEVLSRKTLSNKTKIPYYRIKILEEGPFKTNTILDYYNALRGLGYCICLTEDKNEQSAIVYE